MMAQAKGAQRGNVGRKRRERGNSRGSKEQPVPSKSARKTPSGKGKQTGGKGRKSKKPGAGGAPNRPKVTKVIEKLIIEQSIEGLTSQAIAEMAGKEFEVEIVSSTVRKYQLRHKRRITNEREKELDRVFATVPVTSLETRLQLYQEQIDWVRRGKRITMEKREFLLRILRLVARDVDLARRHLQREAALQLKRQEHELRKRLLDLDDGDEVVDFREEIEKRIRISKKKAKEDAEILKIVGWN